MSSTTKFLAITPDTAFSPAVGQIGSQFVFVKKPNGICPKLGVDNEFSIFWPNDLVVAVKVPPAMLKKYNS